MTVRRVASAFAAAASLCASSLLADVFTVSSDGVPHQFTEFHPTNVTLSQAPLDSVGRQQLYRILAAEQGFSTRPIVRGHKGLLIHANGPVSPSGSDYGKALREYGASVDAGQRLLITNMLVEKDRIIFELNGGPDHKHRFLRHIQVGLGGATGPMAQDDGQDPVGSRVVLVFDKFVPQVTGQQVEQLLAPVIDFAVKSPAEAYVDTLPPKLKETILAHRVLVGMNREMVVAALGPPPRKSRERDGDTPFEEWIYGEPPQDVQFVRINGNRVIRVELAKTGQSPVIRAENEMGDYWSTAPNPNIHEVRMGDTAAKADPDKFAPTAPTLRQPGETLPADQGADRTGTGPSDPEDRTMKPVHFPAKPDSAPAPAATQPPATQPAAQNPLPGPSTATP